MAEHAPHNNNSERKMLNTKNPNAIEVVHRAKISEVSIDRKRINRIEIGSKNRQYIWMR